MQNLQANVDLSLRSNGGDQAGMAAKLERWIRQRKPRAKPMAVNLDGNMADKAEDTNKPEAVNPDDKKAEATNKPKDAVTVSDVRLCNGQIFFISQVRIRLIASSFNRCRHRTT